MSLRAAQQTLATALQDLPELALALERPPPVRAKGVVPVLDRTEPLVWTLALDELQLTGVSLRPRLPFGPTHVRTGPSLAVARASAAPLSTIVEPLVLDPLTVADDAEFVETLQHEQNLPAEIQHGLPALY